MTDLAIPGGDARAFGVTPDARAYRVASQDAPAYRVAEEVIEVAPVTETTVRAVADPYQVVPAPAPQIVTMPAQGRRMNRAMVSKILFSLLGLAVALIWVFPVYWMVLSAFTPNARLAATTPEFLPVHATLNNFRALLASGSSFWPALRMSLTVTGLSVFLVLIFAFLGALAISRFRFRGRTAFILAILFIQMLPAEGLFIAQYRMLAGAGQLNRPWGISLLYTAAIVPFTIWMLRGFVAGVPAELEEAALVDGLSRTQAFFRITLPLLAPGLVASGVYAFLQAWNEFTIALIALPASAASTLPLWLRGFMSASVARGIDWAQVMAASTLIAIPVIIFFLFVQNKMTSGLVSGAVKG